MVFVSTLESNMVIKQPLRTALSSADEVTVPFVRVKTDPSVLAVVRLVTQSHVMFS